MATSMTVTLSSPLGPDPDSISLGPLPPPSGPQPSSPASNSLNIVLTSPADRDPNTVGSPAEQSQQERDYPQGTKFWFMLLAISAVLILGGLDVNIVATAVPSITDDFHTIADVGWYSSAFRLWTCAFQFAFAKLYKLFSTRKVFLLSNAVFIVGSLLCATAASSSMFIVGRAVTGTGFAGQLAGCYAALSDSLPLNRRPIFAGLMACVESLAIIAAPIVGGALTQSLGWRWCFW